MGKTENIREMFDGIAADYDRLNHLMSLDFDKGWRRRALREVVPGTGELRNQGRKTWELRGQGPGSGEQRQTELRNQGRGAGEFKVLDIACGTGDFSIAIAQRLAKNGLAAPCETTGAYGAGTAGPVEGIPAAHGAESGTTDEQCAGCHAGTAGPLMQVTGVDLSEGMLEVMRTKVSDLGLGHLISCQQGNSEYLDFPDASFDRVTIAFGIRNFEHREQALQEILRVLKPGGKLVILELSTPENPVLKNLFKFYFTRISPLLGGRVAHDKKAYTYLPASVLAFPGKKEWMQTMLRCGYSGVRHKAYTFGICRMYLGVKR